jgi:putative copper resistance protein D
VSALLVLARALHIGSALLMTSVLFFRQVVVPKGGAEPGLAAWHIALTRRLRAGLWGLYVLHLVSGAAWLWAVTAGMNDSSLSDALDPAQMKSVLMQTAFGRLWLGRLFIASIFGALLFIGMDGSAARLRSFGSRLTLFVSALLLVSLTFSSHAAAGMHDRLLHIAIDLAHLGVAAVWPIGLIPLAIFLRVTARIGHADPDVLRVLQRFSCLSLTCVILLLLTGLANSLFFFPSWSSVATSTYGQLLIGKVALFLIMIALGAINRLVFLPALVRGSDAAAFRRLRRAVVLESILGLVIILIVGAMGATSPPLPSS